MKREQSKILDQYGKPITKSLDAKTIFGVDLPTGNWHHPKTPSKKQLLEEFRGLVFACVDLIVSTASEIDVGVYYRGTRKSRFPSKHLKGSQAIKVLHNRYRKLKLRQGQILQQLEDHPSLRILERPNSIDTKLTLFIKTFQHLKLTGEAYWYTPLDVLGVPQEIHVLNPSGVKPVIGDNNEVLGYDYGEDGQKKTYSPAEIIPFIVPDPENPHRGKSPLAAVYDALEIDEKLAATLSAILENNGRPDGILTAKDGIGADEAARWEQKFNAKFRRSGNGGIVVLDEDATFNPLTFSPRDMSWLPINEQTRLKICNVWHVPYALLDKSPASQYGVQATLQLQLVDQAVVPMLRLVQDVLNTFFVPKFDDSGNLWMQFDDATPTDREQDRLDVQAGILIPNEPRADRGLEPVSGGDQLAGMYSLGFDMGMGTPDTTETVPESPESTTEPTPTEEATPETVASEGNLQASALNGAQLQSMLSVCSLVTTGEMTREAARITLEMAFPLMDKRQIAALVAALEVRSPVASPDSPAKCDCNQCKTSEKASGHGVKLPSGKELAAVLQTFFARQRKEVFRSLRKSYESAIAKGIKADLPNEFIDLADWDRELYEDSQPLIEMYFANQYEDAAKDLIARAGISNEVFNVTNPQLRAAIKKLALRFCEETNRTTSMEINDAIKKLRESFEEGLTSGERMSQLQDRVAEIFDSAEQSRSWRIAQTEASRAHHEGLRAAAKDSGVVKGFRLMLSSGACELCRSLANKQIGLDDYFHKDDSAPSEYQQRFVPIHPNCQCAVEQVLDIEGD